ncbi:MAG: HD domain-containing protein [Selenomonadaceae bacterium]|nr:HD domain-containing protein [Selenomonadaceae bacterium]
MKAVSVEELKTDMVLARTVTNDKFVVVLSENTILTDQHIERLKKLEIPAVFIKDEFDLSKNFQQAAAVVKKDSAFTHDFEKVSKLADQIFQELKDGTSARKTTAKLAAQILPMADNHASINYLFSLAHMNTTLALHSERVAIFSGIIAKWMHYKWEEIRTIVTAAFLHDVGKNNFPEELIIKRPEKMTPAELETYRGHVKKGYNLVKNLGFDEPVPTVVQCHHEQMNGGGFSKGLSGEKIHPFARIVAVADAYDNLTAEYEGETKKTPFDAIKFLTSEVYAVFDPAVCVPLLTRIKDSLIGSTVTLSNGEKGRVVFYPKDFSAMPIIVTEDGREINLNQSKNFSIVSYSTD